MNHISTLEHLREGIGLRGYAQTNPLQAYAMEGFEIFDRMQDSIDEQISNFLINMQIKQNIEPKEKPIITNDGKEHLKSTPKKNSNKNLIT